MIDIIAGPCSAESSGQVLATASALKSMAYPEGMRLSAFRAGLWKPRTRPGSFEGVGEEGLPWLLEVQGRTGVPVAVEVATPAHLEAVLKAGVDIVWIGSRTATDPFAVQALCDVLKGCGKLSVFVKNPINPDPELWIGSMERVLKAGVREVSAIHRGFSFYEKSRFRNAPLWQVPIDVMRRMPSLPFFCDPSHIAGCRELIPEICQRALDLGFNGLFIESHISPETALSDALQQLTPDSLSVVLKNLTIKESTSSDMVLQAQIESLRRSMDVIDDDLLDLLASRMQLSSRIGECKKRGNLQVLQQSRWNIVLERVLSGAERRGLDRDAVREIFEVIHRASIEKQI